MMKCIMQSEWLETTPHSHTPPPSRRFDNTKDMVDVKITRDLKIEIDDASEFVNSLTAGQMRMIDDHDDGRLMEMMIMGHALIC
eukprot:scaffold5179_cov70-Cyclotella_meneghiniana.AAC.9